MAILTPPASFCGPLYTSMMLSPLPTKSPISSFNQRAKIDGPVSEFWRAVVVIPGRRAGTVDEPGWRDTSAFILSLRGGANVARIYDPRRSPMRGAGGSLPTISLDADYPAGATSIRVKGLTPSQAVAIAADDHFGSGENLYSSISSVGSDADGKATIYFLPPSRIGVAEGDSLNLSKPTAAMQLVGGYMDLTVPHYSRTQPLSLEFFEQPEFEV